MRTATKNLFRPGAALSWGCLMVAALGWLTENWRCQYSVRDVAFVQVHGKAWQLQLLKPGAGVEPSRWEDWKGSLKQLEQTNVEYVWYPRDSEVGRLLAQPGDATEDMPRMRLVGPRDSVLELPPANDLGATLKLISESPTRARLLDLLVNHLCVFLVVESGNIDADEHALSIAAEAARQSGKLLWTLEKPSDEGPAVIRVAASERASESVLLDSLGFEREQDEPQIAVVYGQGRRLGDVLRGPDLNVKKLTGLAGICGSDCECDLDRNWLYEVQMVHRWSDQRERAAEQSLTFDPRSALVVAEVAQILQRNRRRNSAGGAPARIDLGGGLRIHDLDEVLPADDPTSSTTSSRSTEENRDAEPSVGATNDQAGPTKDRAIEEVAQPSEAIPDVATPPITIPWWLMGGLAALVFAVWWFSGPRQR